MKNVNVPGYGAGVLEPDGNLVQYIDLKYLIGHLYTAKFDPEGILSTIPAVSTIISGVLCGRLLISQKLGRFDWVKKVIILVAAGLICIYAGGYFSRWFPVNKNLWTSPFVLYTSGTALVVTGLLYLIMDKIGYTSVFRPFTILGGSPLFVYVGFELVSRTLWRITLPGPGGAAIPLNEWLCSHIIRPWSGDVYDSYYFSIAYMLLWVLIVWIFKKKQQNTR
jgi:predicted acyltransferase